MNNTIKNTIKQLFSQRTLWNTICVNKMYNEWTCFNKKYTPTIHRFLPSLSPRYNNPHYCQFLLHFHSISSASPSPSPFVPVPRHHYHWPQFPEFHLLHSSFSSAQWNVQFINGCLLSLLWLQTLVGNSPNDEPRRKRHELARPNHILLFTIINPVYPITVVSQCCYLCKIMIILWITDASKECFHILWR